MNMLVRCSELGKCLVHCDNDLKSNQGRSGFCRTRFRLADTDISRRCAIIRSYWTLCLAACLGMSALGQNWPFCPGQLYVLCAKSGHSRARSWLFRSSSSGGSQSACSQRELNHVRAR